MKRINILLSVLAVLGSAGTIAAETETSESSAQTTRLPAELTPEFVESRSRALDSEANLDADVKSRAQDLYGRALEQLQSAAQREEQFAQWRQQRGSQTARMAELQTKLKRPEPAESISIPADASAKQLEQMLALHRERLNAAEKALEQAKAERTRRANRREKVPELQEQNRRLLAQVDAALAAPPPPGESAAIVQAQQTLRQATKLAIETELKALDEELPTYDATADLLDLEEKLAEKTVASASANVDELESELTRRRQQQAEHQAQRARLEAGLAGPALEELANENLRLATLRTGPENSPEQGLTAKIKLMSERQQQAQAERQRLDELQAELDERLEIQGISSLIGPQLFSQLSTLPRAADLRQQIADRQEEINDVRLKLGDIRRQLRATENSDQEISKIESRLAPSLSPKERASRITTARELLTQRRRLLADIEGDYTTYFNRLNDLNAEQRKIVAKTEALRQTVDRYLLWARTAAPLGWHELTSSRETLAWLADRQAWQQVARDVRTAAASDPVNFFLPLAAVLALVLLGLPARVRLQRLGAIVSQDALASSYGVTIKMFLWTLVSSSTWPALAFFAGWCLNADLAAADFTRAVGAGLIGVALAILPLEVLRQAVRPQGLAETRFRWTVTRVRDMRRQLTWLSAVASPLVFVIVLLEWDGDASRRTGLGRLVFVLGMLLVALASHRLFRRPNRVPQAAVKPRSALRRFVEWVAVCVPLAIALLSAVGYYYTAWQLALRALQTLYLAVVLILLHGLALRWLRLVRGRLALSQIEEQRPTREAAELTAADNGGESAEPEINLAAVNHDTRRLLQGLLTLAMLLGLWFIWVDVVPGTQLLDRPLWSTAYEVTRTVENPNVPNTTQIVTEFRVVTLADVLLAAFVLVGAFAAARYIAGLLQVSIPQNALMDEGARFALITVVRYVLVALGVIVCFFLLGVGWSRVQWLVAALSIGIGFGLQELVANFISGLIVLFERPVRVGDVVTIGNITGVVTRIKIRTTMIRNWDQQEYFVPNKDLITGRVLNWTLSDKINRITIPVGVAYSSDPRRVRRILLEILTKHHNVLADPPPLVTFEQFGDSSLNFVIRACLAAFNQRLATINDLHQTILERFAEEGIQIPFPQRDLNLRTIEEPVYEKLAEFPAAERHSH